MNVQTRVMKTSSRNWEAHSIDMMKELNDDEEYLDQQNGEQDV